MSEQLLIARANALIQSDQLRPKAKAFLLLKLCQVHALLSSEKAEEYWKQLQSQQRHLADEDKTLFEELRPMIEEEEDPSKGFAGEKIAEIKAKLAEPNLNEGELREFLDVIAEEVRKRFWPGGKRAVWEYLVEVWKTVDRKEALVLTSKLSAGKRLAQVQRMNQEQPLTAEEWQKFSEENSKKEAIRVITAILDEPQPKLNLPGEIILPVVTGITRKMTLSVQLAPTLDLINKFLPLVSSEDTASQVFEALKASAKSFANSPALADHWPEKFNAVLNLAVQGANLGVITPANAKLFAQNLPRHMLDFGFSTIFALSSTSAETLEQNLAEMLQSVSQKTQSEAWFLVLATQRGFGEQAYQLAENSENKLNLVPRICRAWLSNNPDAAVQTIQPDDIKDDLIAQILYRRDKHERVAFLREIAQEGNILLPESMWVAKPPEEEKKGFWGSMFSSGKTFDEIIKEYLKRNPLYVSYQRNTPAADQFTEFLRFNGYGEYNYKRLDPIILEGLILWSEMHPQEVKRELGLMWRAIEPDDDILKMDFLRNAIFERCTAVFAADPDTLNSGYIPWLKKKLVDGSLVWQWGKRQYTVRYPATALASMCLQGAIATQNISPRNRDRLVEIALTEHPSDDRLGELGAQLYNSGKTPLEIALPWKTKTSIEEGWQIGIVKNAIPAIVQEVAQQKAI